MSFYSKLAATSLKLLTKYGRPVTLRQYSASGGDYDPSTGKATLATFIDSTRNCVVADQPGNQIAARFGLTMEAATLIQNKNKWVYMDAKGSQPQLQDHVIFDNVDYTIISSQSTNPGGTPLLYLIVLES